MTPGVYYNELDRNAAEWLRQLMAMKLIPAGDIDERSIKEVRPDDIKGYTQCHFFAGIGGWAYALQLAGWSGPVWTGSCPCQPFSSAPHGATNGFTDDRHLWSEWFRLIAAIRPINIFGEQVANAGDWLDQVCDDLEGISYSIGAAVLPALSVGANHIRNRIYFASHPNGNRKPISPVNAKASRLLWPQGDSGIMVHTNGLPNRVAIRGFGNAIVPQVGAEFIAAYMECVK